MNAEQIERSKRGLPECDMLFFEDLMGFIGIDWPELYWTDSIELDGGEER